MASSSSSTSSPNHTPAFTYDVFLSFRGEDTRHAFTDHLYEALVQAGVRTFRDNDAIDRGQELQPEIETAIIGSRASVVVLSENYANSTWCLDELCLILEQRRKCNHFVLPLFYNVDPSDVRNQRGSFTIKRSKVTALIESAELARPKWTSITKVSHLTAFTEKRSKWTEANVRRWKEALTEVANLTGLEVSGSRSETNLIKQVVETVKGKLDLKQLRIPTHLVGIEAGVGIMSYWLKNDKYSAIAICGMGGTGKTTLAQHIYNTYKQDFESSSFVQEIGKQPDGLLGLQKQLLKDLLGGKKIRISSVSEGAHKIEEVLQMKRVLVVLDDIDKQEQLCALLGTKAFSTQSKIIVTTRLQGVNAWLESISWSCWVHKLKLLNDLESLELLSWHAFGSRIPMEGFKDLAVQLAQYCGGNPLALEVLGSSLVVRDDNPWTRYAMREVWESRVNSLSSMKGDLDRNVQQILQKSFDSLPLRSHRELFLHIACFFIGKSKEHVETILEDKLYAKSGIATLIDRCLLTTSSGGKLRMHQLLQEMGRNIVIEESNDPAKRSRVWCDAESYRVLKKEDGSHTIEGLALDMRKVEQGMRSEVSALKTSSFAKMNNLKLLELKYVELTGPYENFPKLIWLCWHGCPLQTMPSGLLMSSLVAIELNHGHLETFEAPTVLNSLKRLWLISCDNLVSICNFHRLPKLEMLSLWDCSSLTHICKSIGDLENLYHLDLDGCAKLWKYVNQPDLTMLPKQSLFSLPQSLKFLQLPNCGLEFNTDVCVAFHAQSFFTLFLQCNPFEYLPNNIDLNMLYILNLYSCPNLKSLPCIPSTLQELYIDFCTSLERVTFRSGRFTLRGFTYEGCFKLFEVQGLFKLVPIATIDEGDLGDMQWVKACEDYKVDLVGDDIVKGRIWHTQMLYEYGIKSIYLQGIKDQSMPTYDYTSSDSTLSFRVPFDHGKNKIKGLNVRYIYRASGSKDIDLRCLFARFCNISKGLAWVYNPVVYCKPRVDEDVVWLSYWPVGNILDAGDEVHVDILVEIGTLIVCGCGASLVYMDDSEVGEEENYDNNTMKEEEVIGGDLSAFEVTKGRYYLCRRNIFGSDTLYWLKCFFGDNIHYTDIQGWNKVHQTVTTLEVKDYVNTSLKIIELEVRFSSESEIDKIEKAVSSLEGIDSVSAHKETGKLIIEGCVDPIEVATCVRQFDNMMVDILSVKFKNYY